MANTEHRGYPAFKVQSFAVNGAYYEGEALIHLEQRIEAQGNSVVATVYSYPQASQLLVELKIVLDLYATMRPDEAL